MKPDWDKLIDEFKDSKSSLVADVDCTAAGKSLCEKVGVRGYPTIKWGDPNNLQDYSGGRDLEALRKHAEENLGPSCGLDNLDLCDEDTKALITKFKGMSEEELKKAKEDHEAKITKIVDKNKKEVAKLAAKVAEYNKEIEAENKKRDDAIDAANKKSGLPMMKKVASGKKNADIGGKKKRGKGKSEL